MQAEGDVIRFPERASIPLDFSTFFAEEHRGLFKALYFVTGNRADAAELMQDAFLKLWERWDRVDRIDDPTAYLFRVALNGSRMRTRAARRAARRLVPAGRDRDPFDEIELRADVRKLLLDLAPRQRAALLLLDMYGYGSEEAARIMGIRPSTVRALATQGVPSSDAPPEVCMPELKEVFEMVTQQSEPDLDSWNEQEERQRRTARNRKVGVFALAAAIAVVAVVVMLRADDGAGSTTVGTDTTSSPQQVATSFAAAYGAFDAEGAIGYLADDADISGLMLGPADVDETGTEFRLNLAMLDAMGFMQLLGPCDVTQTGSSGSIVQCPFDFHIAGSDYEGQSSAPFTGASYELSVDGSEITEASIDWGGDLPATWEGFAGWLSENHPNDVASMFTDNTYTAVRVSEGSVHLWRRRLYNFVEQLGPCFAPVTPC